MFFLHNLNVLASCRVFHSANITELQEALASGPGKRRSRRNSLPQNGQMMRERADEGCRYSPTTADDEPAGKEPLP